MIFPCFPNRKSNWPINRAVLLACIMLTAMQLSAQDSLMKLWYDHPAGSTWESALPVGNGRIAAMVYGNVDTELVRLNESTVWSGGPNRNDNPRALVALPEIRKMIFQNNLAGAAHLAEKNIQSDSVNGMNYQPVGDLRLAFSGTEKYTGYRRELDLATAVTKTEYSVGGRRYIREVFASLPDSVIVIHLTASQPGSIRFRATFQSPQHTRVSVPGNGEMELDGITGDKDGVQGKVKFQALARYIVASGSVATDSSSITVKDADEVTILVSIATNFVNYHDLSGNERERNGRILSVAAAKSFAGLRSRAVTAYRKFYDRVSLDLGHTSSSKLPTDQRLQQFANGNDPQFVALYFQFGRYLLISASQPGGQPANLQGIWNPLMSPPWGSKYTININTEMNYWPSEATNLAEMNEPLVAMVKDISQTGRQTAKVMYGARGWVAHHNTDLWRITGPVDGIYSAMWPMGGAWLCRHLWTKYLYSGNEQYLRSVYPVIREAALFYIDFLMEEPEHHWLVVSPSMSPENSPKTAKDFSIAAGVTMDNQILFELFSNVIRAARILHTDDSLASALVATRKRLPPMQIGQYGQLQEWLHDLDDTTDKHRHVSHLFGLYPSNQISPYRTASLTAAAKQSLLYRGDVSTGWSMGWKVNLWARLLDGEHAMKLIRDQLTPVGRNSGGGGTYENLFDAHPPFQIDGNFGCASGIAEMLLQSQDGDIHLLPALPASIDSGRVCGLRALGGFEISELTWKHHKVTGLTIRSLLGGNCRIRVGNKLLLEKKRIPKASAGANPNPFFYHDNIAQPLSHSKVKTETITVPASFVYDVDTQRGKEYRFTSDENE